MNPAELMAILNDEWVNLKGGVITVQLPDGTYTYVRSAERDKNGDIRLTLALD